MKHVVQYTDINTSVMFIILEAPILMVLVL